ncbi:Polycomb group RING finger protein 6 [Merluccius polli]|uniref:Polycomb group RING finger protein 6 n=1 Tax=Merluccius polli TaxID=89951 RepID=A0AA47MJW0_MERPO|nr:Polycomb group RING finger protein 6 [Merluccius polli]
MVMVHRWRMSLATPHREEDRPRTQEEDRPRTQEEDRPQTKEEEDRPQTKEEGDRPQTKEEEDRPQTKEEGDRPQTKEEGDRPQTKEEGDRPQTKEEDRPQTKEEDRPQTKEEDRPQTKEASPCRSDTDSEDEGCQPDTTGLGKTPGPNPGPSSGDSNLRPPEEPGPGRDPKLPLNQFYPYIRCGLCCGFLIDATTITECLHTFCKSCIVKHFFYGNRCPTCSIVVHQTQPLYNIRSHQVHLSCQNTTLLQL